MEDFIVNIGKRVDEPSEFYYRTQYILPYVRVRQMRTTEIACKQVTGIPGMAEVYPDDLMCHTPPFQASDWDRSDFDGIKWTPPEKSVNTMID